MLHLYYGDGKGKTTAAVGLAVRAAGAGKRVLFSQFMKGDRTGEVVALKQISNIEILRCDKKMLFYSQMSEAQKTEITKIHNEIIQNISAGLANGQYDVVILDEVLYPYEWGLIDKALVREIIENNKEKVEIICTGNGTELFFREEADYITHMKADRHPFEKGIGAREGIEY